MQYSNVEKGQGKENFSRDFASLIMKTLLEIANVSREAVVCIYFQRSKKV
jgi:hypothetical protein